MKKITFYLFLAFAIPVTAQNFEWLELPAINFSFNPEGIGYPMTVDPSGNVFMSGYKDTPYLYDNVLGNVFFNKYGANGQLLFSKMLNGKVTVYDMVSDTSGSVILSVGWLENITVGTVSLTTVDQGIQPLLLKMDADGNLLWYFQPPGEDGLTAFSEAVATDTGNNVYIGYNAGNNSYISKLSPEGAVQLTITQDHVRAVTSVSVDNAGNIYGAGACSEFNSVYGGVAVPAVTGYNTYVVKYSPTGVYQWLQYVEDVTCPRPKVAARTPDAVYFSSYLFGAFDFGNIQAEGPTGMQNMDFFVAKLDASGNFQWIRETPGDGYVTPGNRNFLCVDAANNVYFGGRANGTIHWDSVHTTSVSGFSNNDIIVLKYDPAGNLQLVKTAGGDSEDRVDGVGVNASGDIFVSGMAAANATFGDFSHNAGPFDNYPFLTKIGGNMLGTPNQPDPKAVLYPNPAGDYFYISNISQPVNGSLYNVLGQKVMDFNAGNNRPVDVGSLSKGAYLVKIRGMEVIKLVKE